MAKDAYTLTSPDGTSMDLPILSGTAGPDVIDIGDLYKQQRVFTYDPGFVATASCESEITFIDGDKGILMYRGYPVEQLAEHSTFIEVAYLLLYGELPTAVQLEEFKTSIYRHAMLNEGMVSYPLMTSPKMVCFILSQGVGTVVIKNWLPLVLGPELAIAR